MGDESAVVASVDPNEVEVGLVGRSDLATVLLGHNDVDADDTAALSVARGVVNTERELVVGIFVGAGLAVGLAVGLEEGLKEGLAVGWAVGFAVGL